MHGSVINAWRTWRTNRRTWRTNRRVLLLLSAKQGIWGWDHGSDGDLKVETFQCYRHGQRYDLGRQKPRFNEIRCSYPSGNGTLPFLGGWCPSSAMPRRTTRRRHGQGGFHRWRLFLIFSLLPPSFRTIYVPVNRKSGVFFNLPPSAFSTDDINTVETAYKVPICPRGNLFYMWPYFISNLIISVNIAFLLTPPSSPHGKSLFTSHFELNSWYKLSEEPKSSKLPFPVI